MSEQQRSAIPFPCAFPVKVMGRADPDFVLRVLDIVRRHVPDLEPQRVRTSASRRGRFVSVTVTVWATSQRQLDQLYLDLNADEHVVMTL